MLLHAFCVIPRYLYDSIPSRSVVSSEQASVLVADLSLFISRPTVSKNSFVSFIDNSSVSSLSANIFRLSTKSKWLVMYIPEPVCRLTFLCFPLSCLLNGSKHNTNKRGERLSPCKIPLSTVFSRISSLPDLILSFHFDMISFRKLTIQGGKLYFSKHSIQ